MGLGICILIFLLLVNQKYTEGVISQGYKRVSGGREVAYGTELVGYSISDDEGEEHPVTSTLSTDSGTTHTIKSKYLIGCDGARSTVRSLAGIDFTGSKTNHHFIRIDGIISSNRPNHRDNGNIGIESQSHGSVLWANLNHGRTRIGFAFPSGLWEEKGLRSRKRMLWPRPRKPCNHSH